MARKKKGPESGHCSKLLERMSRYIEGDLGSDCCGELEKHLAECPECRSTLVGMRRLADLCRECREQEVSRSPDFRTRLLQVLFPEP
ncbi:MAG: hypothetical protein FJ109_06725 [Deltaproteobacteria bacterium]|nr:hypothetical protein [Deltaproteobacteria bacterium]